MILTGNKQEVLQKKIAKLSTARLRSVAVMPHIITKFNRDGYTHVNHKYRGKARAEVLHTTQKPRLIYEASKIKFPMLSIDIEMQVKLIDKIQAMIDANLALDDENINVDLQLALEDAFWDWMLNGNIDGDKVGDGILNYSGATKVSLAPITDAATAKKSVTDLIASIDENGGDDSLAYTVLMPKKYEDFFTELLPNSSSIFVDDWLREKKRAILQFDKDFTNPVAFQATSGNVAFHRFNYGHYDLEKEAGTRALNHLMIMFGAGVVVTDPKQIAQAEFMSP